jgi:hypothetical protein
LRTFTSELSIMLGTQEKAPLRAGLEVENQRLAGTKQGAIAPLNRPRASCPSGSRHTQASIFRIVLRLATPGVPQC